MVNYKGWGTNRKIVVIESDDWGSIRMPSREVYEKLLDQGIRVDKCPYNRYDSLASEEDLDALFEVLCKFKDKNGNHPIITANTVVANPDFEKISASGFKEYHYEPFIETLKRYPKHDKAFDLWQQGIKENVFYPQFHGREHVNISFWLDILKMDNPFFRKAFDMGFWGLSKEIVNTGKINIQASFDAITKKEIEYHKEIIKDGLRIFEDIFKYKSKSFIANNYIWDDSLNSVLLEKKVSILQGMKYQKLPILNSKKRPMIRHSTGEKNDLNQIYLVRNCIFEPSQYPAIDNISSCLMDIKNAFFWNKPAIINSHRLNYIGFINEKNRNENLKSLKNLLTKIIKTWTDVEFFSSNILEQIVKDDA